MIEVYVHVTACLSDGSVEHRVYDMDPVSYEPVWHREYFVVNGSADKAKAIVKLLNTQFNIEINSN